MLLGENSVSEKGLFLHFLFTLRSFATHVGFFCKDLKRSLELMPLTAKLLLQTTHSDGRNNYMVRHSLQKTQYCMTEWKAHGQFNEWVNTQELNTGTFRASMNGQKTFAHKACRDFRISHTSHLPHMCSFCLHCIKLAPAFSKFLVFRKEKRLEKSITQR